MSADEAITAITTYGRMVQLAAKEENTKRGVSKSTIKAERKSAEALFVELTGLKPTEEEAGRLMVG